jgi:DNA polymerase III, delta subunit
MDSAAKKILDSIKKRKYDPVYVLQGEETYYIDLIANYIEANVLSESERSFNQVIMYGKDSPVNAILTNAKRFPMMAERQVVIVREAQDIPDLQKEAGSKLLLDYVSKPVPSTILVLCHKHKTFDKRRELGKKIDQLTVSATFKKPYDNTLRDFVLDYFGERSQKIDESGVSVLVEYVGNDLNRLANEMDKVLISSSKDVTITAEDVMSKVGVSREYNIFELQKAWILQDTLRIAKMISYFEGNTKKNPVIPIVAFLYSFFSKLLIAQSTSDKSDKGLVTALKISPFAVRDYSSALSRYSTSKIIEVISMLKTADLKLKGVNSGSEGEGQILKELLVRIIS